MSERTNGYTAGIVMTVLFVIWTIGWYECGKRVADVWYAAHPVVVHDYNPDGLPAPCVIGPGCELPRDFYKPDPQLTLDTMKPGWHGWAYLSEDGKGLYVQGMGPNWTPAQPSKARKPRSSGTDKITPFRCLDGQILPKDGPCPAPLIVPVLTGAGGDPDYLRDVPAKEIVLEHAFMTMKPCDPPAPPESNIACGDWAPMHEGWTCEDKRRILQVSEDGKYHCILPPGEPVKPAEPHDSDKCVCKRDERGIEYDCVCPIVPAVQPKPIGCEGIFLEGYGDQIHWAKF